MNPSAFVCAIGILCSPVIGQSQEPEELQDAAFLRIELESYYESYRITCDRLRMLEVQIALAGNQSEHQEGLRNQHKSLKLHQSDLRKRAETKRQEIKEVSRVKGGGNHVADSKKRRFFLRPHLEATGRNLDVGIDGPGYFRVFDLEINRVCFSRIGRFDVNKDGLLVLCTGSTKLHLRPLVKIPEDTISVEFSVAGDVRVRRPGEVELQHVGNIEIATFKCAEHLLEIDDGIFVSTLHSGDSKMHTPGNGNSGQLRQGKIEVSDTARLRNLIVELQMLLYSY